MKLLFCFFLIFTLRDFIAYSSTETEIFETEDMQVAVWPLEGSI